MWCPTSLNSRSLLFLIYVNDLHKCSAVVETILFADDTKVIFFLINSQKVCSWFEADEHSLNEDKKWTLFHHSLNKDNVPQKLSQVYMNQKEINRTDSTKLLRVFFVRTSHGISKLI